MEESLREDNISQDCYTNFKDAIVHAIIHEIREKIQEDGWKIKAFEKNKRTKIFRAFMKNGEIKVLLSKKIDKQKYEYKKVIIKIDFPEDKKKSVAEVYIDKILEGYCYLNLCVGGIDVDGLAKSLSDEVHHLLSPDEIKMKFKDKIEESVKIIRDAINRAVNGGKNYNGDE